MEALTAASVAALTVYDMVKGVERGVEIRAVRLVSKSGGKSGEWHRPADGPPTAPRPRRKPGERVAGRIGKKKRRMTGACRPARGRPGRLTFSDRSAAGARHGCPGAALAARLEALGFSVERRVVPDERAAIGAALGRRRARPIRSS